MHFKETLGQYIRSMKINNYAKFEYKYLRDNLKTQEFGLRP